MKEQFTFLVAKCKDCGAISGACVLDDCRNPNWPGELVLSAVETGRDIAIVVGGPISMPQPHTCGK